MTEPLHEFELVRHPQLKPEINLFPFQQYAIYRGLQSPRSALLMSTGLGKTVCAYGIYMYFRMKYPDTRIIILTNKSAIIQFQQEVDNFFDHDLNIIALRPNMPKFGARSYKQARLNLYDILAGDTQYERIDGFVTTHATFRIDAKEITKSLLASHKKGIKTILVIDEATNVANIHATHEAIRVAGALCDRVIALTATVTKGKLEQVYHIMRCIGVLLTPTKQRFLDQFCVTMALDKERPWIRKVIGYKNLGDFVGLLSQWCVIVRKQDVADLLPKVTPQKLYVEHSKEQRRLIRDLYSGVIPLNRHGVEMEDADINNLKMIERLQETASIKFALMDPRAALPELEELPGKPSPKTEEIIRMLREDMEDEKGVVYIPSRRYLRILETDLLAAKLPDQYKEILAIHGDVSPDDREEIKRKFTDSPDYNLLLLTNAGREALNLQAGNVIILTSLPPTGGDLVQVVGRLSRLGSSHDKVLLVYLLTENSQDEDEYSICHQQLSLINAVNSGEVEEGLLDKSLPEDQRWSHEDQRWSHEDLINSGTQALLMKTRSKRKHEYK